MIIDYISYVYDYSLIYVYNYSKNNTSRQKIRGGGVYGYVKLFVVAVLVSPHITPYKRKLNSRSYDTQNVAVKQIIHLSTYVQTYNIYFLLQNNQKQQQNQLVNMVKKAIIKRGF